MIKYKLGVVEADTQAELGKKVVEHCGLSLPDDELIGKKIRFKKVKYPSQEGVFTIYARQKVWGYDENGNYTMIQGYRVNNEQNQFGLPCSLADIEIIEGEI